MSEPRSLADALRGWTNEQRLHLFEQRPDLIVPAPRNSAQLASRATTIASLMRALDLLTAWDLQLLKEIRVGTLSTPAEVTQHHGEHGRRSLDRLTSLALVWGGDSLRVVAPLRETDFKMAAAVDPVPPQLATSQIDPTLVARMGGGAAFDFVRRTEVLLDHWSTAPPGVLKAGGLGVRELKNAAALLEVNEHEAALIIEVAGEARLLDQAASRTIGTAWTPTEVFDSWVVQDLATRWEHLATAWLNSVRLVAALRTKDNSGKALNALDPGLSRQWLPAARRDVLTALAALPKTESLAAGTGPASLLSLLVWSAPRRPSSREALVVSVIEEAAALGVVAMGALTPFGRALLTGADVAQSVKPLMPALVEQVLIQADLTAVAPGPLTAEVGGRLGLIADVESRGAATVYRFTNDSIRRGLDAGWSADDVLSFLNTASASGVPQALEYMVTDLARRFGSVRVGPARCFVRTDDEGQLTQVLALPGLGLRRIAPTVAISELDISTVLTRIRAAGGAPAVEAMDGTLRVVRPDQVRARSKPRPPESRSHVRLIAQANAALEVIASGDRAERDRPLQASATSPADVLALLREAIDRRSSVWLGYLDPQGRAHERVVRPTEVAAGVLAAYDAEHGDTVEFAIHRIRGAVVVEA